MVSCGKRGSLPVAGGANMVAASQPLAAASISDDMKMADFTVSSGRFLWSMIRKSGNRFSEEIMLRLYRGCYSVFERSGDRLEAGLRNRHTVGDMARLAHIEIERKY